MAIRIEFRPKLNHTPPTFMCDHNPIGIHLNKTEMYSHLNRYGLNTIIGKPGTGKTSMLINWISSKADDRVWRKCFHKIYLIMPASSRGSLKDDVFSKLNPERVHEELTHEVLDKIHRELEESTKEGHKSLIIMDDVTAALKDKELQRKLRLIVYNSRHLKVVTTILMQSVISLPRELRSMVSNIVVYKPSRIPWETLVSEHIEVKKETSIELFHQIFREPHDFMFLNTQTGHIYRNGDRVIIKGQEIDSPKI
jgi:KaiC/GvpD/RAD55 family RecA-like ATPase